MVGGEEAKEEEVECGRIEFGFVPEVGSSSFLFRGFSHDQENFFIFPSTRCKPRRQAERERGSRINFPRSFPFERGKRRKSSHPQEACFQPKEPTSRLDLLLLPSFDPSIQEKETYIKGGQRERERVKEGGGCGWRGTRGEIERFELTFPLPSPQASKQG